MPAASRAANGRRRAGALVAEACPVGRPGPGEELRLDDGRRSRGGEPGHERGVEEHRVLDPMGGAAAGAAT